MSSRILYKMDINRNGVDMLIDKKRLNIYFAFVIISVIAVDLFMFTVKEYMVMELIAVPMMEYLYGVYIKC